MFFFRNFGNKSLFFCACLREMLISYRKTAFCGCFSFAVGLLCFIFEIVLNLRCNVIMKKGYRIISVKAADIYRHEQKNGVKIGVLLPEKKSENYFGWFRNYLDYSLDSIELEKAYTRICRKKFSFQDERNNSYTLAVINVKFDYTYKAENGDIVSLKKLREHLYENGFKIKGVHYVRYKRSAGSSCEGTCLSIDERLYKSMAKWSAYGVEPNSDLASRESYKSLSLSSIIRTVKTPLEGILFVPDYKSTFTDKVVSVELQDGELIA